MSTFQSVLESNREFAASIGNPGNNYMANEKTANDILESFTRTYVREDAFHPKILTQFQITDDDLDKQLGTAKMVKIFEKEPGQPAAVSVSLAGMPQSVYIRTPRYAVTGSRILSPMFTINVDELRTYTMDVRQVMNDNALKDILAHEDSGFIGAVNYMVGTTKDAANPLTSIPQYVGYPGGITRQNWVAAHKQNMQKTSFRIHAKTVLANTVTIAEVEKWERNEIGGDMAEKILVDGFAEGRIFGQRLIGTIKRDLVGDLFTYSFSDEQFIGKSVEFEKPTMFMEKRMFQLNYCLYRTLGMTLTHGAGLGRNDFN